MATAACNDCRMSTYPASVPEPEERSADKHVWQPPAPDASLPRPEEAPQQPRFGSYGEAPMGSATPFGASAPPAWQAAPDGAPTPLNHTFGAAPKPGIIPLRPLFFGEILEGSFQALRVNPRAMFVPSLIVMAVTGGISSLFTFFLLRSLDLESLFNPDPNAAPPTDMGLSTSLALQSGSLLGALVNLFAVAVLSGLLIIAVSRSVLGRIADLGETWARTKRRIWALIGQTLLIQLLSSLAIIACAALVFPVFIAFSRSTEDFNEISFGWLAVLIAAILIVLAATAAVALFLQTRLLVAPAALVLEDIGVIASIKRSWSLTRGYFWRVLGISLTVTIMISVVSGLLGGVIGTLQGISFVLASSAIPVTSMIATFITSLITGLILPFQAAANALIYIDLRMRKEALDVELLKSAA